MVVKSKTKIYINLYKIYINKTNLYKQIDK